jgi:Transglycosylase SLT domain
MPDAVVNIKDIPSAFPIVQGVTPAEDAHVALGLPGTSFAPGAADPLPTDARALDRVAAAVEHQESGGNDKAVSPKGAKYGLGAMQISEDVARDFKGDRTDPVQNRSMGRAQLDKMYNRFGNWPDALAAYDMGATKTDEWIAGGRKGLPKETQSYITNVGKNAGLGGQLVVNGKRRVTQDELARIPSGFGSVTIAPPDDQPPADPMLPGFMDSDQVSQTPDTEAGGAFLVGVGKGISGLVTGPVQTALEQIPGDTAQNFTNVINGMSKPFDELTEKHPIAQAVGQVVGATAMIMGAGGMLGGIKAVTTLNQILPAFLRYGAAGAWVGGTQFERGDDNLPRWVDAALNGTLGAGGAVIGSAYGWGMKHLARSSAFNDFIKLLQSSVGDLSKSTSKVMEKFVENYKRVNDEKNDIYSLKNMAQQEFEGFSPNELGTAIRGALEGNRQSGVATVVGPTANKVVNELGLREIAAREAGHAKQVEQHALDYQAWEERYFKPPPGYPSPTEAAKRDHIERGLVPPPPQPPAPLPQQFVSADRFSAGRQAISEAYRSARTPQTRFQLRQLTKALDDVAGRAAEDHGMGAEEFVRRAREANEFFKKNIVPIRDIFGRLTPDEIAGKFTPAEFFTKVSNALKENDSAKLEKLMAAMGESAKPEMVRIAEWEMLNAAKKGTTKSGLAVIGKYISDREDTLRAMLGRDRVEQLKGEANIAQEVMSSTFQKHRLWWKYGTSSILPMIGGEHIMMGAWQGDPKKMAYGVGLVAAPFAVHGAFKVFGQLRALPYMLPMVRKAAKLRPGSPELDRLVRQIEFRLGVAGPIVGSSIEGAIRDQSGDTESGSVVPALP